ncbi:DUF3427 domain-containing protein [Peribacillus loiseleuriae]|uniref:DUF3427 domain-containing protein n=1 Tax=Peribacillus loiseleuriae TaxID=1679170 RepID=UPI0024808351|nr:DUF3427 domain-containing protein [Peribacillus loiseleuriae]
MKNLLLDPAFEGALNELSSKLPLKRIYEFVIAQYLLEHQEISLETANQEMLKFVKYVNEDSVKHAFECLNQDYYDTVQLKIKLFTYQDEKLSKTPIFQEVLYNETFKGYVKDIIHYGLFRYEKVFKEQDYGVPHFKLYEQYQMIDAALTI